MSTTQYVFEETLRIDFEERLEEMQNDPYWQDTIFEIVDAAVPIYNHDRAALWLDMGCPEVDDSGLINSLTNVSDIIAVAIQIQGEQFLYSLAAVNGLY